MNEKTLAGKLAVVTGASRGIGQAIAEKLGAMGAIVIGTATTDNGATKISENFKNFAIEGRGKVLNIADDSSINNFFESLQQEFRMPDILINNAGITKDNLLMRMKDEEWDEVILTNLTAIFKLCRIASRAMMKQRWGRIINISSVSGCAGIAGQTNYAASKAGMIGFSKALAKEIATRGVTVNVVAPGFIKSDMTASLSDEYQQKILSEIPMARQGEPNEVAAAVAFLSSLEAGYITGQTIHVNGGIYMV